VTVAALTEDELRQERKFHATLPSPGHEPICLNCKTPMPCKALRLLETIAAYERHGVQNEAIFGWVAEAVNLDGPEPSDFGQSFAIVRAVMDLREWALRGRMEWVKAANQEHYAAENEDLKAELEKVKAERDRAVSALQREA